MEKRYVLKKGDYYLSDIEYKINPEDFSIEIFGFTIEKDYRQLFSDFDKAEEIRKYIFIETGLDLEIKLFKKKEE